MLLSRCRYLKRGGVVTDDGSDSDDKDEATSAGKSENQQSELEAAIATGAGPAYVHGLLDKGFSTKWGPEGFVKKKHPLAIMVCGWGLFVITHHLPEAQLGAGTAWHSLVLAQLGAGTAWRWHSLALAQLGAGTAWRWHSLALAQLGAGTAWRWHSMALAQLGTGQVPHILSP